MKRIIFLIIASLLVMGVVLPGCPPPVDPVDPVVPDIVYRFPDGIIHIGLVGDMGHPTGDMARAGALVGAGVINAMGGVSVGGIAHNISIVPIDTDEAIDASGITGRTAILGAIDGVDFLMGGFRTEAMLVYREAIMDAEKIFFNTGAATEALQHSVVTDYDRYRFFFKATPYNEHFLAKSVLRLIDSVATGIRAARGLPVNANLTAVIISEDLKWARDEQEPAIRAGLPTLNIVWRESYFVSAVDPAPSTAAVVGAVATHDPDIFIPIYSGLPGAVFAGTLAAQIAAGASDAMSVGINVVAQLKAPWAAAIPTPAGPPVRYHVLLDTWADGLNQTALTGPFRTRIMAALGGEYPLYTAATYDVLFWLEAAIEANDWLDGGVGAVNATPLIEWLQNPANAILGTTGRMGVYPRPGTTVVGVPTLTEAQVRAIYPGLAVYRAADWGMPPHTTHDLIYGPGWQTGIGAQWQWDAAAGVWRKMGVWPRIIPGANLVDQYGNWNFAYPGTVPLIIPPHVTR